MSQTTEEINMNLLHLAASILSEQSTAYRNMVVGMSGSSKSAKKILEAYPLNKTAPTADDIIAEAEKLKSFVRG